jgi:hypothetical protein
MPGTPSSTEIRALTTIISAPVLPRLPCSDPLERLDVRIPIATSIDDFTALAEVLEGEYQPSRRTVVAAVPCGSFFCLVVPLGIAAVLLVDRVPVLCHKLKALYPFLRCPEAGCEMGDLMCPHPLMSRSPCRTGCAGLCTSRSR